MLLLLLLPALRAQQKADSLVKLADKSNNDSLKVKLLNDAVWEMMFVEKENSLKTAKRALSIAEKTKNLYSLSDCYNTLGVYYYITSEFNTALDFHKKAREIREKLKDVKGLMSTYNNLASVLKELGNYQDEVKYYFDALRNAEIIKDSLSQARIFNNIADAFKRQERYDKSEEYNRKALEIRLRMGDIPGMISCYINLGNVKHEIKDYTSAEAYFKKTDSLLQIQKDNYLLAKYYANYGSLLKDMDRLQDALRYFNLSVETNELIGNHNSNLVNYVNIAALYHQLHENKKANEAYAEAAELSHQLGNKQWERQSYEGLSNTFAELNNYEAAFDARLKYEALKDTLRNSEINELFADLSSKYEVDKKNDQIKLLAEKNKLSELQVKQRTLLAGGIALVALMLLLLGYFAYSRNRIKNRLKTEQLVREAGEQERMRIAKDIHDELGSGLTKIRFMSEVYASKVKDNSAIKSISDTSRSLVENMRDLIWVMNPENTKLDSLIARIREYSHDYLEEFPFELKTDLPLDPPAVNITKEAHRNIFMIVKECLQNSVKYSGAMEIRLKAEIGNDFVLVIEDNGKGFDANAEYEGNGLKNMRSRMRSISGEVTVTSATGKGTKTELRVSLENIRAA